MWAIIRNPRGVNRVVPVRNYAASAESFIEFAYEHSLYALAVEYRDGVVIFSTVNKDGINTIRWMAEYYGLTVVDRGFYEGLFELRVSGFGR
jgi:hypothetical protein